MSKPAQAGFFYARSSGFERRYLRFRAREHDAKSDSLGGGNGWRIPRPGDSGPGIRLVGPLIINGVRLLGGDPREPASRRFTAL